MAIKSNTIIPQIQSYIQSLFINERTGHDYYHAMRVKSVADKIADKEDGNRLIIDMAALLHDAIDDKMQDSLNKDCPRFVDFFASLDVDDATKDAVLYIMNNMSYSKMINNKDKIKITKELEIVSDADKIDSIGAIGIARCFAYGAKMNRLIYDPTIPSEPNLSEEEYKRKDRNTTSFNHFDEKLLKIGDFLFTDTAKEIAKSRLNFIKEFQTNFLNEWNF